MTQLLNNSCGRTIRQGRESIINIFLDFFALLSGLLTLGIRGLLSLLLGRGLTGALGLGGGPEGLEK